MIKDKALAQPEQEPVAWMDDYNACKCPDNEARCFSDKVFRMMQKHTDSLVKRQEPVAKVCHDLDGHIGWNPNLKQLPNEGTPLYTSPLQRKPEQEPVAWMFQHEETGRMMFVETQQLEWGFEKGNPRLKKIGPVYTAPPQRKPLSDEQTTQQQKFIA